MSYIKSAVSCFLRQESSIRTNNKLENRKRLLATKVCILFGLGCTSAMFAATPEPVAPQGTNFGAVTPQRVSFNGYPYVVTYVNGHFEAALGNGTVGAIKGTAAINIPKSIQFEGKDIPVTAIKRHAFQNWEGTDVTFAEDSVLQRIEAFAFHSSNLKRINLPESLISIENTAFCATQLKSIRIPSKLAIIPEGCFAHCSELESVEVAPGSALVEFGHSAFAGDRKLRSFNIPNTVNTVGGECFSGCNDLSFPADWEPRIVKEGGFRGCRSESAKRFLNRND
ncbi:MAG: leucine-rich repeat domain-containing protein [Holosporales bacterium]|jgi:hypothetical protein|nr:leucine-rich repeat domain-containing protein [Holosporales bacterium]